MPQSFTVTVFSSVSRIPQTTDTFKVDTCTKHVRSHTHNDEQGGGDIMKEAAKHPTAVQVCGDILDCLQVINMTFSNPNQVGFVISLTSINRVL